METGRSENGSALTAPERGSQEIEAEMDFRNTGCCCWLPNTPFIYSSIASVKEKNQQRRGLLSQQSAVVRYFLELPPPRRCFTYSKIVTSVSSIGRSTIVTRASRNSRCDWKSRKRCGQSAADDNRINVFLDNLIDEFRGCESG